MMVVNNRLKLFGFAALALLLALVATSCQSNVYPDTEHKDGITLTPVDLFEGESAKFKPFLGTMSGAVKLRYNGDKPNASLTLSKWENGKKTESFGSIMDVFFVPQGQEHENPEVEIIISIERISAPEQEEAFGMAKVSLIHETGSSTMSLTIPWSDELRGHSTLDYHERVSFAAEGLVPVWGMQGTTGNILRTADLSAESLSELEWALILSLDFEDDMIAAAP